MKWDKIWEERKHVSDYSLRLYSYLESVASQLARGSYVLEAGCGSGAGLSILSKHQHRCVGIDISKKALNITKKNPGVEIVLSSIFRIPFPDEKFDLTYNSGVIEHFPYPENINAIREMKRITKLNGRIIIIVPNSLCLWYLLPKKVLNIFGRWPFGYEENYSPRRLCLCIKEVGGMEIKKIFGLQPFPPLATHNLEIIPIGLRRYFAKAENTLLFKHMYSYSVGVECIRRY